MQLSAQLFNEILQQVRSEQTADESRLEPRVGLRAEAMLVINTPKPGSIIVRIRDLCRTGMGFTYTAPLKPGQWFVLHLPRSPEPPLCIPCQVTYCRSVNSKLYSIGAKFARLAPHRRHTA